MLRALTRAHRALFCWCCRTADLMPARLRARSCRTPKCWRGARGPRRGGGVPQCGRAWRPCGGRSRA